MQSMLWKTPQTLYGYELWIPCEAPDDLEPPVVKIIVTPLNGGTPVRRMAKTADLRTADARDAEAQAEMIKLKSRAAELDVLEKLYEKETRLTLNLENKLGETIQASQKAANVAANECAKRDNEIVRLKEENAKLKEEIVSLKTVEPNKSKQ